MRTDEVRDDYQCLARRQGAQLQWYIRIMVGHRRVVGDIRAPSVTLRRSSGRIGAPMVRLDG